MDIAIELTRIIKYTAIAIVPIEIAILSFRLFKRSAELAI